MFLRNLFKKNKPAKSELIFMINIALWKRDFFQKIYHNSDIQFVALKDNIFKYQKLIKSYEKTSILVWGYRECKNLSEFANKNNLNITRVEDGFVRSFGLGVSQVLPNSLCFDKNCVYYNGQQETELERMVNHYQSYVNNENISYADTLLKNIIKYGISKYNLNRDTSEKFKYPKKSNNQKRILVVGQVEHDASIKYSNSLITDNLDLLKTARKENPDAQIIFKQHPDNIYQKLTVTNEFKKYADVIVNEYLSIKETLDGIDHVYTISSLLGWEALIRNIKVTVFGIAFYSNWGLTDDRQSCERRIARPTLKELFVLIYMEYPKYFNNEGEKINFREFFDGIFQQAMKSQFHKEELLSLSTTNKTTTKKVSTAKHVKEKTPEEKLLEIFYTDISDILVEDEISEKCYFYIPWIKSHGDKLVSQIKKHSPNIPIKPFNLVRNISTKRNVASTFANNNPVLFKKVIIKLLLQVKNKTHGFILTLDWQPFFNLIAQVCNDLNINTILIPHEGIFLNRDLYYCHPVTKIRKPICSKALVWGKLQKEIFIERGYEEKNIIITGSPKLDFASNFSNTLSKDEFCKAYSLSSEKKILLFCAQYLDNQIDQKLALESENQIICDLIDFCVNNNSQLIIRLPPNKNIISSKTQSVIDNNQDIIRLDFTNLYLTDPNESIYHSDIVIAINSTMLLEAYIMRKNCISVKYCSGISSPWGEELIPVVYSKNELQERVSDLLNNKLLINFDDESIKNNFGNGNFDGSSLDKICDFLIKFMNYYSTDKIEVDCNHPKFDVVAISSKELPTNIYIDKLLDANTILYNKGVKALNDIEYSGVSNYFQWGNSDNSYKRELRKMALRNNKPIHYIEDGFIRSVNIGLLKEPGLSITFSKNGAYYNSNVMTSFEEYLNSNEVLSQEQFNYCTECIEYIVSNKISKYNHAPIRNYSIGRKDVPKILLIDQRYGDASVEYAQGNDNTFEQMLSDAINNYPEHDILIKQHPDSLVGGKESYFNNENLSFINKLGLSNIHVINIDINPYSLLNMVDEVFVCSSGMGFEALMAKKKVHCYGLPWYAGWGCTDDKLKIERRKTTRSIEELFYVAYIKYSRYYHPELDRLCDIKEICDYIIINR